MLSPFYCLDSTLSVKTYILSTSTNLQHTILSATLI
nr:MAG TPA: hypothetical protein [Caudoviricetes sp.]